MWSTSQTSSVSKRQTPILKPLKLVVSANATDQSQSDSPSNAFLDAISPHTASEPWRKDFKLTRVVNRERKKLSTATMSSTSTSDSSNISRMPLTPPPDLPGLDGQLRILEDRFEVVENMIVARRRLFDNLDKESANLNVDLQKKLSKNQHVSRPHFTAPASTENFAQQRQSESQGDQDGTNQTEPLKSAPGDTTIQSRSAAAAGWGGYLKRLW